MARHNSEVVLRALLNGQKIELPTYGTIALDENSRVITPVERVTVDDSEMPVHDVAWLVVDLHLESFLRACEQMTADSVATVAMHNTLQRYKQK